MPSSARIVSTLPTATEILFQLGLGPQLVGVSHECTYPAAALTKPRITSAAFNYTTASSRAIDTHVKTSLHHHRSLYQINEPLLRQLRPTHIITQQLCAVCAITPTELEQALIHLPAPPRLISLNPVTLQDIWSQVGQLGQAFGRSHQARQITAGLQHTLDHYRETTSRLPRRRVVCIEWLDPIFAAGHWVPEMVALAGGHDPLAGLHTVSRETTWNHVLQADPEIIILMPCGFPVSKTLAELPGLASLPHWRDLQAVQNRQVWVVDSPAYFSQSGPRVISGGVPLLAQIIHPSAFHTPNPAEALNVYAAR